MLDLRMRSFLEVVETGSYTAAAKKLNLTQPAVTQHSIQSQQLKQEHDLTHKVAQAKEKEYHPRPRFSAGYGDFPLETQGRFFAELDCARKIGLSLTDSFLMTPTKSVTAVVGLSKIDKEEKAGCAVCEKTDCAMRRK